MKHEHSRNGPVWYSNKYLLKQAPLGTPECSTHIDMGLWDYSHAGTLDRQLSMVSEPQDNAATQYPMLRAPDLCTTKPT